MRNREVRFPPFRLDATDERLYRDDQAIELRPKTFAVLRHLLTNAGQLVTKHELLEAVWPGISVTDTVLKGCIAEIRAALQDDPAAPRFVETAHRRGYRFIGRITSSDSAAPAAAPAVAFGREGDLARMHGWFADALAGTRQVVFVTGEPGIGKTTLVDAFAHQVGWLHSPWIARGQCLEHFGTAEAYLPVLDALGRLHRQSGGERLVALLRQHAPTWLAQMPALLDASERHRLAQLASGGSAQRMLREMGEALDALTRERPLLLVLEDLHWSDPSTLQLLAAVARRRDPARLFVVGTYRPDDVTVSHPLIGIQQELQMHQACKMLALPLLPMDAVADYIGNRFRGHTFPGELPRAIHERTDGHPLFVVSVVDELVSRGAILGDDHAWTMAIELADVARDVPDNVRQMVARRVDRVADDDQRVLEAASIEGVEFSCAAVAAAIGDDPARVEEACERLSRRTSLLRLHAPLELRDGTLAARYRFAHVLYQRALNDRVSPTRRAALHHGIGEGLERLYGADSSAYATPLAVHFEEGRDWPKAARYFQLAATNASRRFANEEAAGLAQRGLSALQRIADESEYLSLELGLQMTLATALMAIRGFSYPAVEQAYRRAHVLCTATGARPELFPVLWGLARFYLVRTPLATSLELGHEMMRLAAAANDPDLLLQAHNSLGATLFHVGDCDAARTHLEHGLALYDRERHHRQVWLYVQDPGVVCLARLPSALWCAGFPARSAAHAHEALALAHSLSHPFSAAFAFSFCALAFELRRDYARCGELAELAINLSSRQGFSIFLAMAHLLRGAALVEQGQHDQGLRHLYDGMNRARAMGADLLKPYSLGLLARSIAHGDRVDEARDMVKEGLETAAATGEHFYDAELHRLDGELLLRTSARDAPPRAETAFRSAIAVAERQRALSWMLRATTSLARLLERRGQVDEAHRVLSEVYARFTEGHDSPDLAQARAVVAASI